MSKQDWNVSLSVSIEQLNHTIEEVKGLDISNEGLVSSIGNLFRNTYNTLRLTVNQVLRKNDYGVIALNESFIRKIDKNKLAKNYAYLLDTQVEVPIGMKGKYLPYSEVSLNLSTLFSGLQTTIEDLRADIGRIISTEEGLLDSSLFDDKKYLREKEKVEKVLTEWSTVRQANDLNPSRPFGEVFQSANELVSTIDNVKASNDYLNQINRKKLVLSIETTMRYISDLIEATNQGYSKPLVLKVAKAVSAVAEIAEVLSATTYNAKMLSVSLDKVNEKVVQLVH